MGQLESLLAMKSHMDLMIKVKYHKIDFINHSFLSVLYSSFLLSFCATEEGHSLIRFVFIFYGI